MPAEKSCKTAPVYGGVAPRVELILALSAALVFVLSLILEPLVY
jgi:hypothetical protein